MIRPTCVPNPNAVCSSRHHGVESCEEKRRHLFLEMDHVSDTRCCTKGLLPKLSIAVKNKALESKISSIILIVYQSTGIEKEGDSRQSLENQAKIGDIRRISNQKFDSNRDVHLVLAVTEEYSKPTEREENQYASGVMGMSFDPLLSIEAGAAYMNFEVTELLKFWTENVIEFHTTDREKLSLGLLPEKGPEVICVQRNGRGEIVTKEKSGSWKVESDTKADFTSSRRV